jgi:hypothetical protein
MCLLPPPPPSVLSPSKWINGIFLCVLFSFSPQKRRSSGPHLVACLLDRCTMYICRQIMMLPRFNFLHLHIHLNCKIPTPGYAVLVEKVGLFLEKVGVGVITFSYFKNDLFALKKRCTITHFMWAYRGSTWKTMHCRLCINCYGIRLTGGGGGGLQPTPTPSIITHFLNE